MCFDIPNTCGFEQKRRPAPKSEANTTVMADNFVPVMYAIEADNQPRLRGN
jgi:hypothetical protein